MKNKCTVIKMNVDLVNLETSLTKVEHLAALKKGAYVCVSNVHMCMETFDCHEFKAVVNNADLVIPDGRPISWAQKLLGHKNAEQVRGQDIMNELCRVSGVKNLNIGLYGGSSDTLLEQVISKLKQSYPNINITFSYSPPFRPLTSNEDNTLVSNINHSGVNVLFVGIGCPKQEIWMAEHKEQLNCVMLGVGAAFDFIAGSKNHAPKWMQKFGLEWLFRLCSEPSRLWKRYFKQNPRFIYYFSKKFIKHKLAK
jgi:N-acetylglucosaminyldiphosphoundecaprenol N-acetyl-beta-D-mannosaminyltransferase